MTTADEAAIMRRIAPIPAKARRSLPGCECNEWPSSPCARCLKIATDAGWEPELPKTFTEIQHELSAAVDGPDTTEWRAVLAVIIDDVIALLRGEDV